MALIWDGKYHSTITFYASRALRIFPLYWTALLLTLILGILKTQLHIGTDENAISHYFHYSQYLTGGSAIAEFVNFLFRNLTLIVNKDYISIKENLAPGYLIVNQAWTLQVELLFYLFVPLVIKLKKHFWFFVSLYFIFFYGLVVPFQFLPQNTLTFNFLNYFFYFLLGMCSYKYIYKNINKKQLTGFSKLIFLFFLTLVIFYQILPGKILDKGFYMSLSYYMAFAVSIPYLFKLTKNNKFDRFLGELSYPVYITHMLFVKLFFALHFPSHQYLNSIIIATPTLIFSILLVKVVQDPVDRFRHRKALS
jgi:peptidoglycan/LPS O-acetylase OafA/YrhL